MTNNGIDASQRTAARIAGIAFVFGIAIVVFGEFWVSAGLIVPGNAAETARNLLAHESRFRVNIACNLLYVADLQVLAAALYVILKPVNSGLALAATLCRLVFATMWLLTALNMLAALGLLGDAPYLHVIETERLQALARARIRESFNAYYVGLPFFALASTFCSWLWLKSRYIPRSLAAFGVAASAWCVFCAFVFIVFPDFNKTVNDWWFDSPMALFELATGLWLLIGGLGHAGPVAVASERVA